MWPVKIVTVYLMRSASQELVRAVSIAEGVKQIVAIATRVRSIATNAILLAHRAGDLARGFGVLSRELRGFTEQVTAEMNTLSEVTMELVAEVSTLVRQNQRTELLRRARQALGAESDYTDTIGAILKRHAADAGKRAQSITKLHERLDQALIATDRVGQFGTVLARTALIESAYGGEHGPALSGVAREFNQTILQIIDAMRGVRLASHTRSLPEAA